MQFGKINNIESQALTQEFIDYLYPIKTNDQSGNKDRKQIETILKIFSSEFNNLKDDFTCLVFEEAMEAFVSFANEVYNNSHNEATGLIVGYYLHDPNNPEKKIVVGTNFLHATGDSSNVTCEFSYEDSARHSKYCEDHKVLPIVWIHSHPGFGVFYSDTDKNTLRNYFKCAHQLGIVVDNIRNQYLAYKFVNGIQTEIDIWGVNVQRSIETNSLKKFLYNAACNNHEGSVKRETVSYKELKGSNSQNIGQGQSVSFKKAVDNDKPYINELRKNTERLKDRVQELGYLINEFYSVIEQKESGIKNEAKFTLEDIKKEISSQIYSCADEIKQLLNNIGAIKDKIEKLEDSFVSLNSEVAELKQLCIDTLDKQNIEFSNVSNLIIELKEICSAIVSDATFFQSINRRGYRFLQNKKNKLFIIIFLALAISILGNIFGIYHFIDKSSDSSNEETTEKIVGNNKSK